MIEPKQERNLVEILDGTRWKDFSTYSEAIQIHDVELHCAGVYTQIDENVIIAGSAASIDAKDVFQRAAYEFLERIAVFEHIQHQDPSESIKQASNDFTPARSNGIAAGSSFEDARDRALSELMERDLILRSWFGQVMPEKLDPVSLPASIERIYRSEAILIQTPYSAPYRCVCHIMIPKVEADKTPVIVGFGCATNVDAANVKAAAESIQRLAFLWGEEINLKTPDWSKNADFHQEYYLSATRCQPLLDWIQGNRYDPKVTPIESYDEPSFLDITPNFLKNHLAVVKAVSNSAWPLFFGRFPYLGKDDQEVPHPIC